MMDKNKIIIITAVVLAAFILSLAYSFYFKINPAVDAAAYDKIAWNLVQGNGYKESADLPFDKDIAILRVGPGYEFFLALIYYVFGHYLWVVWIIHALLSAAAAYLVFLLSKEIFKESRNFFIGVAAASFMAFSPDLITMSGMIMTEILGVFLIILSVYLFFKYINSEAKSVYLVILAALAFGAAVLVRTPIALLFLPFAGYFIFHKNWRHFLFFSFALILIFLPWTLRNYQTYHSFIPTNLAFGYDLLAGNHSGATGELEPYYLNEQFMEQGRIEGNKLALKEALFFIFANPLEFLKITFYRISIYFSFARPTGFWFHLEGASRALTLALSALYSVLLFVFGFFGIYGIKELPPTDKKRAKFFIWTLLAMPLAVVWIIVETRYRFLVYPFFAVFAGYGLWTLFNKKIALKILLGIFGILFLNTAFDAWRNSERIIERIAELL
ncbi:MAG: glycosyltransferase family 39 protein [Candidatus Niyogibacteria bacterium]|nr:glycosyltransferase family 39 protein [Candidatus Niyogibacteria bacterium]